MVGGNQQGLTGRGTVRDAVTENEWGAARDDAAGLQDVEVDVEGNLAERDDHPQVGQQFQFTLQPGPAVSQFLRCGLIAGRGAGFKSRVPTPSSSARRRVL